MLRINARTWLYILMGLALVFILSQNASIAGLHRWANAARASLDEFEVTDALPGAVYAEGGLTSSPQHQIIGHRMPTAGPLSYEDLKKVEREARRLLDINKQFREAISPHNEQPDFEELVQRFDYEAGFTTEYSGTLTLQDMLDIADSELRQARDMYAYLAVYANESRFRADTDYWEEPDNLAFNCPEQPVADDPIADPPVVDWCNFAARMRESLREAAYLRMIFGQQFTADALGFTFSADIVGGEAFVRDEVRKLEMAAGQFQLAREAVAEGLDHYLGNGCYVYSFYTEAEWALLSRAVEGLERARHHIAVRMSYLAPDESSLPAAQAEAQNTYRAAAMDQYTDMILTANLAAGQPVCERGTRPDNDMVAKMVADMLSTRQSAREMGEGRNIFGFDVSFTPARPYCTPPQTNDTGFWEEASDRANQAADLEGQLQATERYFDQESNALRDAIIEVKTDYDNSLADLTGCPKPNGPVSDEDFFNCVNTAADKLRACDPTQASGLFDSCVAATGVTGQLKEEWKNLQLAALDIKLAQQKLDNLAQRQIIEEERNATVKHETLTNAQDQALMEFLATLLDSLSVSCGAGELGCSVSYNPAQPAIATLRMKQTLRQAAADVAIEDANSEAVVRNLLLDAVELQIDLEIAAHKFNAQLTVFENLAAGTLDLAVEARRARAYVAQSPANDPSYRLIRDSARLDLADRLQKGARTSYLAAKRAEYEYAIRLSASDFRISDIYRARTAQDILDFLADLETLTNNISNPIDQNEFTLSVAQHVLGWTDEELGLTGEAARAERARRFQAWVADHTETIGEDPALVFSFTTSPAENGVFSNLIGAAYDHFWLHKIAGVNEPRDDSDGLGVNLITSQSNPGDIWVAITQSGLVHLKAYSGCIFEYRLIHPAALFGLEWPAGQDPEVAYAVLKASINGQDGEPTNSFRGRPVSATDWQVVVYANGNLNLQLLEDVQLVVDTTRSAQAREPGVPDPRDCVRIDY